jgi:type IV fimbrial biogenesis protein FimT
MTLIELVVGLAIAALLALTAAPFFADYTTNSRLREAGNLVFTEALFAQSEAIKRNRTVRLSTNGASVQLHDMTDPANPTLVRERTLPGNVQAAVGTVSFTSQGWPADFAATAINLSLANVTCSGDLRCPGLRVDGGGGIRLCGNQLACT